MKPVFPNDERLEAAAGLRWLQQLTGPTRDLDVMLLELPSRTAEMADLFADDMQRLAGVLADRRHRAQRALVRGLGSQRFQQTWGSWRRFLEDEPAGSGPEGSEAATAVAGDRILKLYRRMVRAGQDVPSDAPAEVFHDLRKQGKELRYMFELFGPLWSQRDVQPVVSQLKALQDVLGRFHDGQVQAEWLRSLARELAAEPSSTDTALAIGAMVDRLASDGRDIRETFAVKFAPFASPATRALVRKTFAPG
jgi:CHAD domain-containing protein